MNFVVTVVVSLSIFPILVALFILICCFEFCSVLKIFFKLKTFQIKGIKITTTTARCTNKSIVNTGHNVNK